MAKLEHTKIKTFYIKDYEKNKYDIIDKRYLCNDINDKFIKNILINFRKEVEEKINDLIVTRIEYQYLVEKNIELNGYKILCRAEIEIPIKFIGEKL